jgi:hypothetical protein
MPDYTPSLGKSQAATYIAGAAITGGQVLDITADNTVSPSSGAAVTVAGVAGHDAATGAPVTVHGGSGLVHDTPCGALSGPAAAPVPTTATTGGTVLAGVYTVAISYTNAIGETVPGPTGTVTTTGTTSTVTIPSPPALAGSTGWYAYVSQAGLTALTRQQTAGSPTAVGTPLVLTAPPTSSGLAPQASNSTGPAAGALITSAAAGAVTGGATAGSELGVALKGASPITGNCRWKSTRG